MSQSTPSPSAAAMDDASGGSRAFVIIVTIGSITTISLRFWSRSIQRAPDGLGSSHISRFWWDDWAALAAMVRVCKQEAVCSDNTHATKLEPGL